MEGRLLKRCLVHMPTEGPRMVRVPNNAEQVCLVVQDKPDTVDYGRGLVIELEGRQWSCVVNL